MIAAWPIASLVERGTTDADYDALWRLHVDTMRAYVAATYGWVDSVQQSMFREAWPKNRAQRVLVDQGTVVATWRIERRVDDLFLALVEVASSISDAASVRPSCGDCWPTPPRRTFRRA
jgi:hypothetical protein